MIMKKSTGVWAVFFAAGLAALGSSEFEAKIRASYEAGDPVPAEIFKIRDQVAVHYFAPTIPRVPGKNPCFVFIHGGGWKSGTPAEPYRWCRYLAQHGISAFSVNYQLSDEKKGIKPTQCLKDAKTAVRWLRAGAERFGIDPDRIAAGGPSAGGHLSAALATIDEYNDSGDDVSVSCRPDLLLLVSPVMDNGPGAYGNGWNAKTSESPDFRVQDFWEEFSPVHNLNHDLPASLVLMGDSDPLISIDAVEKFGRAVEASGSDFEWFVFPGKGHGLFAQNKSYLTPELMHIYYAWHAFLAKHGWMDAPPPAGDEVRSLVQNQDLAKPAKCNMIVILADDMGIGDIGAFRELYPGGPEDVPSKQRSPDYEGDLDLQLAHRYTPNLDRLAKEGVRCTRAYSGAWCAPSRQMLLSGQWSCRANAYDHPWMGAQLRSAGYVTGMVGKSHGARPTDKVFRNLDPQTAEFDDGLFFNNGARAFYMKDGETLRGRVNFKPADFTASADDYITDVFTDHAVQFIERHADEPFMLYLPYTAPHEPLHGKPQDLKKLFPDVFADRSDAEIRAEVDGQTFRSIPDELKAYHYAAMVYAMDRGIGRVFQTLEKYNIDQNTLIIFSCDNGAQWGCNYPGSGHKSETRDGGIRVPFIVWSADIEKSAAGGSVYNGLVSLADIAPTLLARASDNPAVYPTDGTDILPYLTRQKAPPVGRTFFWANACSGNTLKTKLDGAHEFSDDPLPEAIMQTVLVKDDEKITCWNASGTDGIGAVYNRLPDVAGKPNPADFVTEKPPVSGQVPVEGPGRELLDEMVRMIRAADGGLTPTWSGAPADQMKKWKWFCE
jgi:arylsulfatase A-like enzyme/acetyl esterase/lipase